MKKMKDIFYALLSLSSSLFVPLSAFPLSFSACPLHFLSVSKWKPLCLVQACLTLRFAESSISTFLCSVLECKYDKNGTSEGYSCIPPKVIFTLHATWLLVSE